MKDSLAGSDDFPFDMTTGAAISMMLGHTVELREAGAGCWTARRWEILLTPWGWRIARTVEYIGGEGDRGRLFFCSEAVAWEIVRPAMPDLFLPPGRN